MKRQILWDSAAEVEVDEAFDYYAERSRRAAEGFREQLLLAVERIAQSGEAFPVFDERGNRRCLLERYPFGVLYELTDEYAIIIVVMHTSRRPGYWKGR